MLFVMGMETLTAIVIKAVQERIFRPLAGILPTQRISVYADDVVAFFRPEETELRAVQEILDLFGDASGLRVNYRKTTATLIRGDEEDAQRVIASLGCKLDKFPIKYLGLPLALRPLTKAEWQPFLDMVIDCIPAWQRGLIARAGRLILIKNVILARPVHHLLAVNAPVWLLEEIDKWTRAFFWAGKKEVTGGQCLVAWETICQPTRYGGLGVKDLRLQGLALRARWTWLRWTDPSRPWQGLPAIKDSEAEAVFQCLVRIQVGNGRRTLFWKDGWIDGRSVVEIAPEVVAVVPLRWQNKRMVDEALQNNSWVLDIIGSLTEEGCRQCVRLWMCVTGVQRNIHDEDVFRWKGARHGIYTAKDTYDMLCQGRIPSTIATPIWKS
jgi:hypothetical protein